MFGSSFFWRLYTSFMLLIVVCATTIFLLLNQRLQNTSYSELENNLETHAIFLKNIAEPYFLGNIFEGLQERTELLGKNLDSRLTIIDKKGVVLAESEKHPDFVNNHWERPEIQQAFKTGYGQAVRYSDTVEKNMKYLAIRLSDESNLQGFIRVGLPLTDIQEKQSELAFFILLGCIIAAFIALIPGFYIARKISKPIISLTETAEAFAEGFYEKRIYINSQDELGKLAKTFNFMAANAFDRVKRITEDRNRLATILSGLVEGVIAIDEHQNIIHINDAAARLLKISAAATLGTSVWNSIHIVEIHEVLQRIVTDGGVRRTRARIANSKKDTVIDIYGAALDKVENKHGAVLVLHDISDLEMLEKVRRDFVINASHELKTPLTAIRGVIETILSDPEMEKKILWDFLHRVQNQSDRLVNIVTGLMALSRLESDQLIKLEPISLKAIVNQSLKSFKSISAEKNIILINWLDKELGEDTDARILGDAHLLGQLFDNLIDNALKYTRAGGSVNISLTRARWNNEVWYCVAVKDNGIGLSEADQDRVFERFYRVDKGRSRELGGTGLGLSICKHITEQHQGHIEVESALGKGSCFKVFLPVL